jgi:hypothetical protein
LSKPTSLFIATKALRQLLLGLLRDGRVIWDADDAPVMHGWLEYAEAALEEWSELDDQ